MLTFQTLTRAQREALLQIARPDQRILLACARCAYPCVGALLCKCCKMYKSKVGGGTMIFYPDDGKGHYPLCSLQELKASLNG